jgi:hypothetical protein
MLKQTFESSPLGFRSLVVDGPRVSLGSFHNVLSDGRVEGVLSVSIGSVDWDARYDYADPDGNPGAQWSSSARNELCGSRLSHRGSAVQAAAWSADTGGDEDPEGSKLELTWERLEMLAGARESGQVGENEGYPKAVTFVTREPSPDRNHEPEIGAFSAPRTTWTPTYRQISGPWDEFEDEADLFTKSLLLEYRAHVQRAMEAHELAATTLQGVRHIGPSRIAGQRIYSIRAGGMDEVGSRGEHVARQLIGPDAGGTNAILRRLGVQYEVRLHTLPTLNHAIDVRLADLRNQRALEVGISDVGFGISQLLPMVVEWAGVRRRASPRQPQTFLVEQPELHLHPRLQMRLVREFCRPAMNVRALWSACPTEAGSSSHSPVVDGEYRHRVESTPDANVQVIVETHSETVVLAVQQLVRSRRLAPDDVCIIAFDSTMVSGGLTYRRIRLTPDGEFLDSWPEGFSKNIRS